MNLLSDNLFIRYRQALVVSADFPELVKKSLDTSSPPCQEKQRCEWGQIGCGLSRGRNLVFVHKTPLTYGGYPVSGDSSSGNWYVTGPYGLGMKWGMVPFTEPLDKSFTKAFIHMSSLNSQSLLTKRYYHHSWLRRKVSSVRAPVQRPDEPISQAQLTPTGRRELQSLSSPALASSLPLQGSQPLLHDSLAVASFSSPSSVFDFLTLWCLGPGRGGGEVGHCDPMKRQQTLESDVSRFEPKLYLPWSRLLHLLDPWFFSLLSRNKHMDGQIDRWIDRWIH